METASARQQLIRQLNDQFRRTLVGGRLVITPGIRALAPQTMPLLLARLRQFDAFDEGNDPYGEHDFGGFEHDGNEFLWKIDYYDPTLTRHSDDPTDPSVTLRVLTLMVADEY